MRCLGIALLALIGCDPVTAVVYDGALPSDTGAPLDSGVDTVDTGDTGAPPPVSDTALTETVEPGPPGWDGERDFTFDDCQEAVFEEGVEITHDPDYAAQVEACEGCDLVFRVEVEPDRICTHVDDGPDWLTNGFEITSPVYRGLIFDGDEVVIYEIRRPWGNNWSASEYAEGAVEGDTFEYTYEGTASRGFRTYPFTATGFVDLSAP